MTPEGWVRTGARNLITDVPGIEVGEAHDQGVMTGVTVVLPKGRAQAGVSVMGGAPGTRETDALEPHNLVGSLDAVVLAGGSVYGLAAADGVTAWLAARGRGYVIPGSDLVAPVVPAAILFDLLNGGNKDWGEVPPYRDLGFRACAAAGAGVTLGNAGAGYGAVAGAYKGGQGTASAISAQGFTVGAIVAVNAVGSPVIPGTQTLWAFALEQQGEMGNQHPPVLPVGGISLGLPEDMKRPGGTRENTTIGVIATDAALSPGEAKRLAIMAQGGYARALRPSHTGFDGDVVFALSTGAMPLPEPRALGLLALGSLAADVMTRAVGRAVFEAQSLGRWRAYRELHGKPIGHG
ncbi:MAG: P1 family peptidase [Alphaproteobacteria bacterium]|nr:P1 family peptidase [Alphaproteobacteria bacterium]